MKARQALKVALPFATAPIIGAYAGFSAAYAYDHSPLLQNTAHLLAEATHTAYTNLAALGQLLPFLG